MRSDGTAGFGCDLSGSSEGSCAGNLVPMWWYGGGETR